MQELIKQGAGTNSQQGAELNQDKVRINQDKVRTNQTRCRN
nr:hypothetical protein [Mycoplasmopsis bovis]